MQSNDNNLAGLPATLLSGAMKALFLVLNPGTAVIIYLIHEGGPSVTHDAASLATNALSAITNPAAHNPLFVLAVAALIGGCIAFPKKTWITLRLLSIPLAFLIVFLTASSFTTPHATPSHAATNAARSATTAVSPSHDPFIRSH